MRAYAEQSNFLRAKTNSLLGIIPNSLLGISKD